MISVPSIKPPGAVFEAPVPPVPAVMIDLGDGQGKRAAADIMAEADEEIAAAERILSYLGHGASK
ncbi:hypothetical protein [Neorhizobium sp. T25_13]|uniref:hypothetical protein n=1 Tax=Neorhizobium sp. T25_13 TaxID=2093830 RepID=UPI000CFA5C61|nr:hypothetical protein [Neorhizobium sp. T25_13]